MARRFPPLSSRRVRAWLAQGLGNQIAAAMMTVTVLVLLLVGGGSYLASRESARDDIENSLHGEARVTINSLQSLLLASIEGSGRLASRSLITEALRDTKARDAILRPFLRELRDDTPALLALSVRDRGGAILAEAGGESSVWPPVDELMAETLKDGRPRLRLVRMSPALLVSAHPIRDGPGGAVLGAVMAVTDLDKAARAVFVHLPGNLQGQLLERNGAILVNSGQGGLNKEAMAELPLAGSTLIGSAGLRIAVGLPENIAYAPLHRMTWSYLLLSVFAMLVALYLARMLARGIVLPLRQLSRQAKAVADGGKALPAQFAVCGHGEIDVLSLAFQRMLTSLRDAHEDQEAMIRERTRDLADAQRRLEGVLGSIHDMIYAVDLKLEHCLYASPAGKAIFGVDADTLKSGRVFWLDAIHPEDRDNYQRAFRQAVFEGAADVVYRLAGEGRQRWVYERFQMGFDAEGAPDRIDGVAHEITRRKEAERERQALEASLRLHDRAMAQSGNGIVITDMTQPGQPVIYVNPAFERITGYSVAEVLGRNCNFLQQEDLDQPELDVMRQAIAEEREAQVVLRNYRKDGSLFWNELAIAPVRDAAGRVTHYIGAQNDISERRLAERALEDQSRRLNTIFSLSPDGFVSFDADGGLGYVNPAFQAMTGLTEGELLGLTVEAFDQRLRQLAAPGSPYPRLSMAEALEADSRVSGIAGGDILALVHPSPRMLQRSLRYSDSRQAALTLYFRDVTRETEVDRMKSEFLSTAAHELRTPLASIMGFAELLLMREYDEKRRRDMLETMHRQSKRLTNLLNELLDLARIEARQGKDFKREKLPLGKLLTEVLAAFYVPDDPRTVETRLGAELPVVDVDRAKFQQALFNVLSNAFKYSPEGGVVRLETLDGARHGVAMAGVRISDQGIGMNPEQLSHLFERFWRADTTGHIPGTGLGMSLVKEILELHGGGVDVESEYGKGTVITLWLPATAEGANEEVLALAA